MKKTRLDDRLIADGAFATRDDVIRSVIAGEILVDDVVVQSAAQKIDKDASIRIKNRPQFVSRGGYKLQGAIDAFDIDVSGLRCIDVGASTGGFTDCLLQQGAASVACVDVNYSQLAWSIRTDPRTTVFERTNIKQADPDTIGAPFDVIVIDVSFIGLASLAPTLSALSHSDTILIALVKPQFEAKRDETVKGVVVDESIRARTLEEVASALSGNGFETKGTVESPIKGPAGNVEFLIYAIYRGEEIGTHRMRGIEYVEATQMRG